MAGRSPHILVVDDDVGVQDALVAALGDTYRVHTASSEAQALGLLREQPVSAIILDAMLGEEDGLALMETFRSLSAAPILILTGHSSETLAIRAVWAKADGYLRKPVDGELLRLTLTRVLSTPLSPRSSRTDRAGH
jgi:DNA-binding response OmpR family regulator